MWICLNDAFFSVVASDRDPAVLNVRARRAGDIERHFPSVEIVELPDTDYAYRAFVPREAVAAKMSELTEAIAYTNFKNSVKSPSLRKAYGLVWSVMLRLQTHPPAPQEMGFWDRLQYQRDKKRQWYYNDEPSDR